MKSVTDHASTTSPARRQFMRQGLVLAAGLGFGNTLSATSGGSPAGTAAHEPMTVFDSHLHCPGDDGDSGQWYPVTKTFDDFVAYLDRTGVGRGVVNSVRALNAKTPAGFIAGNRDVARHIEKYKGRFLGACQVHPAFPQESARELEDCRKQLGFVWVGEICNYIVNPYEYTSKNFALLVEQIVKLNMVLHVHTELDEMQYLIRTFPQATIVFAHFGDSHEEENIFKRIDAVAAAKNCYLDTSGYGHDRMGVLEYAVKSIGPDRILFGSDFTVNDPSTVLARIHCAFLTEEQKLKILSENLQALLKKFTV